MKRSQPEPSTSAPPKKQAMTKIIETVSIGPVSTEEEMNTKVLIFQNKKLAERLEILKIDEERLRERLDDVSHKRDSEFEILSEINRHWIQFDEDVSIMQQSYEDGTAEEFGDQSDTALSYLEHLSQLESNQMKEEVTKRAANSKHCIQKLLSFMEKARCFPPRPSREPVKTESKTSQTAGSEEMSAQQMETDEPNEPVAEETKAPDEGTCKVTPEPERKPVKTPEVPQPMVSGEDTELEEIKAENRRLRELMTSLQQKQQITSLEFSEIRDKYALKQREISELNTQLQDSEYDLQKANHRVENLVKRLNELEEMKKKIREGDIPSKQESNLDGQEEDDDEKHSEFTEVKALANNRLDELQKLKEGCVAALQEVEKLKLEAIQIPESIVVQSSPYKCLQSQFTVLFNEVSTNRQQLDDVRRALSTTKTQHMVQLEQIESEMTTTHKKYKGEVTELHEALLHCKKEYDLLRIDYEQITKSNEQSAPLIREISYMNNSLQSYNKQLKGEIMRYKRKLSEAQTQTQKLEEELAKLRETEQKEGQEKKPGEEDKKPEEEMEVPQEEESKTIPKVAEGGEEGELEEGEEEEPTTSSDCERIKQLQASLKKSQESQKEMKLLLDVYKGAAKDLREKVELLASEKTLKAEIQELQQRVQELEQELEKYKGAMADEEAIRRLKMAEETIEQLQKNLAATKQEEDALLAEMEFTGQEYVEMQEQNMRLLQQLREKDDANLKLMSERIKSNQIQKQIRDEKDVLADQVTSLNAYREAQTQLIKKQEERERALQNAMGAMEKELNLRQQAMEMHKRKTLESVQAVQDLKIRLEAFQQQQQEVQESMADKTRSLEEEAFRAKRVQEECNSLKRKLEKQKKIDLYGAADEVLLEEVRQYKARLTCPCCNTRKKDAILTKCFHVFCFECLKTRYDTRQRKCPKCNATFGNNDFHKIYL